MQPTGTTSGFLLKIQHERDEQGWNLSMQGISFRLQAQNVQDQQGCVLFRKIGNPLKICPSHFLSFNFFVNWSELIKRRPPTHEYFMIFFKLGNPQ